MEENRKFLWMVVVLLALVAAALLYGVYNRYAPKPSAPAPGQNAPQSANGQGSGETSAPNSGTRTLTGAEQRILAGVEANVSDAERQAYTDSVIALAKDAAEVSLKGCVGEPLVSKASKLKGEVAFHNTDNSSHLLAFNNGKEKFTIEAGETKKIKPSFGNGLGFYTYTCDNQTSGILMLGE